MEYHGDVREKKILDLGCGEGGYSRELAKRVAQPVSIDCSTKAISYAMAWLQKIPLYLYWELEK